ncbi:hypothetical protein BC828DRAFT_404913 [Blastocladiella britannica]|nr:hypothetical protein BC828DRAFT_404913 [Blastocladiella britannica]
MATANSSQQRMLLMDNVDLEYEDIEDEAAASPSRFASYAMFKFFGHAIASPSAVAITLMQAQFLPNARTRRRLAHLGSGTDSEHSDSENYQDFTEPAAAEEAAHEQENGDSDSSLDPLDELLSSSTASAMAPNGASQKTDNDGFLIQSSPLDGASRPPYMLPPLISSSVLKTMGVVRRHPDEGTSGLFKGLSASFFASLATETIEPLLTTTVCDSLGLNDTLPLVDHDNPVPIAAVCITTSVIADVLLSPLDIARVRLILQTSRPDRKYRGLIHALRTQFMDARINPYSNLSLLFPTVAVSLCHHMFGFLTPLLLDRGMGISEVYNPLKYALLELFVHTARDLMLVPLQTAQVRLYAQPSAHPRDGRPWLSLVPLSPIPYSGLGNCVSQIMHNEGGSRADVHALAEKKQRRDTNPTAIGLWARVAPLYQGLASKMMSNVLYCGIRILTEIIEITDGEEF